MDGAFILGIIIVALIYVILILFVVSIPVFSFIMYRRMSKEMTSTDKGVFGLMFIMINLFILIGAYFFIFKGM